MRTVIAFFESGTQCSLGIDKGPYKFTRPELDVRVFDTLEHFENLTMFNNPVVEDIMNRNEGYGCTWGDSSKLFPVTEEDIRRLREKDAEIGARKAERRRIREEEEARHAAAMEKSGLCKKCGTWCYGDCEED